MLRDLEQPKTLKAQITKNSLILATASLLRSEGPSAISYRKVAKLAGAASSSVGYHFESLDELLEEAARYNMHLWIKRARKIADIAENQEKGINLEQCADLLISACMPDESESLSAHYLQLILASESKLVTGVYKNSRAELENQVQRILNVAKVDVSPRLVYAVIDGAAIACLSENRSLRKFEFDMLKEVLGSSRLKS